VLTKVSLKIEYRCTLLARLINEECKKYWLLLWHEYILLYIIGPLAHKYPGPSTSAYGIDTQQQYQNSYKYV
jgi:hypothetical protein